MNPAYISAISALCGSAIGAHWVARDQLADTTSSGQNATRSAKKYRTNLCGIHRFSAQVFADALLQTSI
jgi:hypothetical protein